MFIEPGSFSCFNQKHDCNESKNAKIHHSMNLKKTKEEHNHASK